MCVWGGGGGGEIAGFRKCGIVPLDVKQVLSRLPNEQTSQENDAAAVDRSLIEILKEPCGSNEGPKLAKKSKRIIIMPGKSIDVDNVEA